MKNYLSKLVFIFFILTVFLPNISFAEHHFRDLGEAQDLSLTLTTGVFYNMTDRHQAFFDVPVTNMKNAGHETRLGLEWNFAEDTSLRLDMGYQRIFYSNIGILQIKNNFFVIDTLISRIVFKNAFKERVFPYITAGQSTVIGVSGQQSYLAAGGGLRYAISRKWSARFEPMFLTDFSGVRPSFSLGLNWHFD